MSQESSLTQSAHSVRQVLTAYTLNVVRLYFGNDHRTRPHSVWAGAGATAGGKDVQMVHPGGAPPDDLQG
jgi:hypothetical protein